MLEELSKKVLKRYFLEHRSDSTRKVSCKACRLMWYKREVGAEEPKENLSAQSGGHCGSSKQTEKGLDPKHPSEEIQNFVN